MRTRRRRCRICSTPAHKKGGMVLSTHDDEARSTIDSTTGGVMTAEVGAITGELEVATRSLKEGLIEVAVRYTGAEEWYIVEGSPINCGDVGNLTPSELRELHERVVRHLESFFLMIRRTQRSTLFLYTRSSDLV